MNISTSECSSGCESGWTMYLDQLSNSTDYPYNIRAYSRNHDDDDEDEDLSMVSDASSGPPHFQDYSEVTHNYGYASSQGKKKNKQKNRTTTKDAELKKKQHQNLFLDDTASSPVFQDLQDNVAHSMEHDNGYSQVFNSAHFEGESKSKKQLGFFKSSTKGISGSLLGRKRQ